MKLNSDNTNLAENKVLILYILDKLNKDITNTGLFKIISSINNINYFYNFYNFWSNSLFFKFGRSVNRYREEWRFRNG